MEQQWKQRGPEVVCAVVQGSENGSLDKHGVVGSILRGSQDSCPLVYIHCFSMIQSGTNPGSSMQRFCRCNEGPKLVDFVTSRLSLVGLP